MERLYTPNEVADLFRVTRRTVWEWIRAGKVKAITTPAKNYLIPESEITRLTTVQ